MHRRHPQAGGKQEVDLGYYVVCNHLIAWEKQLLSNMSALDAVSATVTLAGNLVWDGARR